jgi:hypothetical protein
MNSNGNGKGWVRVLWTLLAFVACSIQVGSFLKSFRPADGMIPDFYQEWSSARNCLEGLPIYAPLSTSGSRHPDALNFNPDITPLLGVEYNAHPPTSVLLALPLARLHFIDAFLAWSVVSLLALGVSIGIILRQCPSALTRWSILPVVALLLGCYPLQQQILEGQLNLLLLLLFTGAWAADRSERPWLAGSLVGAATAIKLFPGYLLLYFAARRNWRPLVAATCSFLVLTVLTLLLLGPKCYGDYESIVMPSLKKWHVDWFNLSLAGFWHRLFDSQGSNVIPLWQSHTFASAVTFGSDAVVTALTGWCIWNSRSRRERDLAFALTVAAMLLVSPITWNHYITLTFLPLFLLWLWASSAKGTRLTYWVILIGNLLAPLLIMWWLAFKLRRHHGQQWIATPGQSLTIISVQTYALVALFIFILCVLRKSLPAARQDGKAIEG